MNCLAVPASVKQEVLAALDRLPLPARLAGKVSIRFEFNIDPAGILGDVQSEISMRETLVRK